MITTNEAAAKLLKHAPLRISIAATGAGAGLQRLLWEVPGISAVLAEASFPYATEATDQFLGFKPERYCSARTALELAMQCYYRAYQFKGPKAIGVGLSASVSTAKEHRGEHRVYAAWFSDHGCQVYEKVLAKTSDPAALARLLDGTMADKIGLLAVLEAVDEAMSSAPEVISYDGTTLAQEAFWAHPAFTRTGKRLTEPKGVEVIFPGAFNPPHVGHFGMAAAVKDDLGSDTTFHITAESPHKAPLTVVDMLQRAKMLEGHDRIFTRGDPLYVDKARRFPGCVLLIGPDALERMLNPKWGPTPDQLAEAFVDSKTLLCTPEMRLVEGREVRTADLPMPDALRVIIRYIPGRWDISSSELRATSSA